MLRQPEEEAFECNMSLLVLYDFTMLKRIAPTTLYQKWDCSAHLETKLQSPVKSKEYTIFCLLFKFILLFHAHKNTLCRM